MQIRPQFRAPFRDLWARACALLALTALAACTPAEAPSRAQRTPPAAPVGAPWSSTELASHPLVGRIWRPATGRFVESADALDLLAAARHTILGEKHDNPDHHRIQAWIIGGLAARGRRPAVAVEMLSAAQREPLDAYLARHPHTADGLGAALQWEGRGWPDWAMYRPVFQAALDAGAPILPANLTRAEIRGTARAGAQTALGAERVRSLGLGTALPAPQVARLRREIVESHCNRLPEAMIDPMVTVMTARDAQMAGVMRAGAAQPGRDGSILIAGKGHARNDHGVPLHLRRAAATVASLGLLEVTEGVTDPAAYGAIFDTAAPPFDLVWFTPRVDDEDPCARFADQLERARKRHEDDASGPPARETAE